MTIKNKFINFENIAKGIFIFSIGLFKKLVIADTLAVWVNNGYAVTETLDIATAWVVAVAYYLQLYFDYSGYIDMATGLALLFNIILPVNFFSPMKAKTIQDFWRRWNMTLTRFLREYIFLPLGGARKGRNIGYINLAITFLLGGLWHGADWTFVFWGFLNGSALVFYILWKKHGVKLPDVLAWVTTFVFLVITAVFFRAETWTDAIRILKGMIAFDNISLPYILKFENNYNIRFDDFLGQIGGDKWAFIFVMASLAIALCFKTQWK